MQHFQHLHRSETIVIRDFCCRPKHAGSSGEERATSIDFTVTRTGAFLRCVNGEQRLADPNFVTFFNRNEPYTVTHPLPGGDDCTVITMADDSIRDIVARFDPSARDRPDAPFPFGDAPIPPRAFAFHHRILACVRRPDSDLVAVDESVLALAAAVVRSAFQVRGKKRTKRRPGTRKVHARLADDMRSLLNRRFRDRISLGTLSRAVHASAYHAARVFRAETGTSVHQYLNRLRLRTALEHVAGSPKDLTLIALEHGFSSHSHFTDSFTREFGTPPSAFRAVATGRRLREMSTNLEACQS